LGYFEAALASVDSMQISNQSKEFAVTLSTSLGELGVYRNVYRNGTRDLFPCDVCLSTTRGFVPLVAGISCKPDFVPLGDVGATTPDFVPLGDVGANTPDFVLLGDVCAITPDVVPLGTCLSNMLDVVLGRASLDDSKSFCPESARITGESSQS